MNHHETNDFTFFTKEQSFDNTEIFRLSHKAELKHLYEIRDFIQEEINKRSQQH